MGLQDQPQPTDYRGQQRLGLIDHEAAGHRHGQHAAIGVAETPARAHDRMREAQALVPAQIGRMDNGRPRPGPTMDAAHSPAQLQRQRSQPRIPCSGRQPLVRQGKRHHVIAVRGFHEMVAAGHDHHELASVLFIHHRRSLPARGQRRVPQLLAGLQVDGAQQVIGGGAMKISPLAVTTEPPLFGVPISIGRPERMPNGPLPRALPNGRSHNSLPVRRSMARMPP